MFEHFMEPSEEKLLMLKSGKIPANMRHPSERPTARETFVEKQQAKFKLGVLWFRIVKILRLPRHIRVSYFLLPVLKTTKMTAFPKKSRASGQSDPSVTAQSPLRTFSAVLNVPGAPRPRTLNAYSWSSSPTVQL